MRTAASAGAAAARQPSPPRGRQPQPKQQQQQQQRNQRIKQPAPSPLADAEEAFYAESVGAFHELGLAPAVVDALAAAGFTRPSRVQELVIPRILSGKDVVLAAETGSGKTLAYVAPVATLLLQKTASGQLPPGAVDPTAAGSSSSSDAPGRPAKHQQQPRWLALVLCANTALCHQVVRLMESLTDAAGAPLLSACHVSSSSPPPFTPPDMIVTTPGALVTLFNDRGASYGSQWTAEGVSSRTAFVVVDEADLLCQGGYVKDLTRLLDAFKAGERRLIEAQVMAEAGLDPEAFARLPRQVRAGCWEGGLPGMVKAGYRLRGRGSSGSSSSSSSSGAGSAADQQQQQQQEGQEGLPEKPADSSSDSGGGSSKQGQYGPYFSRQYLFVAATMPALTKADVGTELQKRFKDAVWVSGDMLHQIKPHVEHVWVPLDAAADAAAAAGGGAARQAAADASLLTAITSDPDYQAGTARILVFTRDVSSADRVSAWLQQEGVANHRYHKAMPLQEQAAALAAMAAPPTPGQSQVMVSTDAAARGLDLPGIGHVIQADFAANAIEFLHRVGRTARAGRGGRVTSLYGGADAVLAEALQGYIAEGRPVEDCFSRNRSFSRKVKRYGKFVPRGVAPDGELQDGELAEGEGAEQQQQQDGSADAEEPAEEGRQ